jgi:hypothetical protein
MHNIEFEHLLYLAYVTVGVVGVILILLWK